MARILIVDDALMMRKVIRKIVEDNGHIVVDEAENGEQAIEMYKRNLPDVVTMDITMPKTNGIEALDSIVKYDSNAKVIMVSALGQQHKVMEALDSGAKSYILKPITAEKLISVINQVAGVSSCPITASKSVFECGAGREQKSCDQILQKEGLGQDECTFQQLPFTVEKKEEIYSVIMTREFRCEDFAELLKAVQGILVTQPKTVMVDFTCPNVLNSRMMQSFLDIMTTVINTGKPLQIICYTDDYMKFFRNVLLLQQASFKLVKR